MKTIILKLSGPLQAWGTNSHFETRHTERYPSKSAIIGLIAGSLGYKRDSEKISKLNELDFAVRIDQAGELLRDYHTARKYKHSDGKLDRVYVTNRYYLSDAVFLVAIGHEDTVWMDEIEQALKSPYYQQFMGRRSLPLNADFLYKITNESVMNTLRDIPWLAADWYKKKNQVTSLEIYADANLLQGKARQPRRDRVVSFSQKNRQFAFRMESRDELPIAYEKMTSHDAFGKLEE